MDADFQDLQNLINRFKDFPVVERKPSFLEIAGFPSRETVWRNIFAFYFDPNECHGFKDLFLRSFFDALGIKEQSTGDFDSINVRTECPTKKGNYLDLVIRCSEFVIGIEMKVNAALDNDLDDYGELIDTMATMHDTMATVSTTYKVVLSNGPCQPDGGGFGNLRYADFIPAIKQQFGNYVLSADPKYTSLLVDFLDHVTRYIGGYAMDIHPKQLKFMQDNHKTVTRLIDTHNQIRQLLALRTADITDAVVSLDSIKLLVTSRERLFTDKGNRLSKMQIQAGQLHFWLQLGVGNSDYSITASAWIDDTCPDHERIDKEMDSDVFTNITFCLWQPLEEVVSVVEKHILMLVDYLKARPTPKTVQ